MKKIITMIITLVFLLGFASADSLLFAGVYTADLEQSPAVRVYPRSIMIDQAGKVLTPYLMLVMHAGDHGSITALRKESVVFGGTKPVCLFLSKKANAAVAIVKTDEVLEGELFSHPDHPQGIVEIGLHFDTEITTTIERSSVVRQISAGACAVLLARDVSALQGKVATIAEHVSLKVTVGFFRGMVGY